MSQTSGLMQLGMAPSLAIEVLGRVQAAQTATGSTQTDAFQLTTSTTVFTTVAAVVHDIAAGRKVPSVEAPSTFVVANLGANALLVYPATGQTINTGAANASLSVPAGKTVQFWGISSTGWIAQVGA